MLCAGADALVVDDLLTDRLEPDVDADEECETVCEIEEETCVDRETEPAEDVRERMKVGVCVKVGTSSVSVGMTRELGPKKGALEGSNNGPLAIAWC